MTIQDEVVPLNPFTHTLQDRKKIWDFDFIKGNSTNNREKVRIEETHCILVTVGGKFLEKKTFKKVMKKIDEIRKITIRKYLFFIILYIKTYITYNR